MSSYNNVVISIFSFCHCDFYSLFSPMSINSSIYILSISKTFVVYPFKYPNSSTTVNKRIILI